MHRFLTSAIALAVALVAAPSQSFAHHVMGGGVPDTLMSGLLSGFGHPIIGIDHLAFIVLVGISAAFTTRRLLTPLVFIAAKANTETLRQLGEPLDPANWAASPMILPERGLARRRVDEWFQSLGAQADIYAQVAGNEAIVSMVSLGFGVGVVPQIVLNNSPLADTVRVLDVTPGLEAYDVGLFTLEKKLASPLISAFWSQLQ